MKILKGQKLLKEVYEIIRDGTEYSNIQIFENRLNIRIAKSYSIIRFMIYGGNKIIWNFEVGLI